MDDKIKKFNSTVLNKCTAMIHNRIKANRQMILPLGDIRITVYLNSANGSVHVKYVKGSDLLIDASYNSVERLKEDLDNLNI